MSTACRSSAPALFEFLFDAQGIDGARAQNSRSACRLRARQVLSRQAARGRRDATHREIAVVRLLAGCGRFKVGCWKFTDWARRQARLLARVLIN